MAKTNMTIHTPKRPTIVGLKGEVFSVGGKIAGVIPPIDKPFAIQFEVVNLWPADPDKGIPAWADVELSQQWRNPPDLRINPDIIAAPFFRFFDLIYFAVTDAKRLSQLRKHGQNLCCELQGEQFIFLGHNLGDFIIADTVERVKKHRG